MGLPRGVRRLRRFFPRRAKPEPATSEPRLHTLAAADKNESTETLVGWAIAAGLDPVCVLPAEVPALLAAIRAVTNLPATSVWMWCGEQSSIIAAGNDRSLRFVRVISVGTESLVDALARPLRSSVATGGTVTLDRVAAI